MEREIPTSDVDLNSKSAITVTPISDRHKKIMLFQDVVTQGS